MSDELIRHEGTQGAIQTLRLLLTIDSDEGLAIAKTGVKDGFKGLAVRGMSVLQRWNEMRFSEAFLSELEEMKREGKIREDFDQTDAGVSSVREFFELIDGKPDAEHFRAFCALFMSANAPDADSNEAILDLELMSILRHLSAGEMHLLSAFLKVRSYKVGIGNLMGSLAKELGYNSEALVSKNASTLVEQSLIDKYAWNHRSSPGGQEKQLLTDLGMALSNRIQAYNEFKERSSSC